MLRSLLIVEEIVVMRVDSNGRVIDANAEGKALLSRVGSDRCHRAMGATDLAGRAVCNDHCVADVTLGRAPACQSRSVVVRERLAQLECHRVGSEVVVLSRRTDSPAPVGDGRITHREREVLRLVAQGMTTNQVAAQLKIRPSTVRTHMEHTLRRLGVHTRAQAVRQALETGQI